MTIATNAIPSAGSSKLARSMQQLLGFWKIFRTDLPGVAGLAVILVLILLATSAPILAPFDPYLQSLGLVLQPPSWEHWAGTDELGRDILSRLLFGARTTLLIVISVSLLVAPIGLCIGVCSGYFGGWVDKVLMRIVDIFLALPSLVLALAFVAALGSGAENAVLAMAFTAWPPIARLARAETLSIRSSDFISAARMYGASPLRIIFRHIVPLCLPSIVVRVTLEHGRIHLDGGRPRVSGIGRATAECRMGYDDFNRPKSHD